MQKIVISYLILCLYQTSCIAIEWSGNAEIQTTNFFKSPLASNPQQTNSNASIAFTPEFYQSWDNDLQSITIEWFGRLDNTDKQRSHNDIREFSWLKVFDTWELKAGISKVYWGVSESQHLVDIINQTDFVENLDGEDKLGQSMLHASKETDWGIFEAFILPDFRERTFSGVKGRPNFGLAIDNTQSRYASKEKNQHTDYAVRWLNLLGDWEVGFSQFIGTSREAVFTLGSNNNQAVLIPNYLLMQQSGIDVQAVIGDWLWKFEAINRHWKKNNQIQLQNDFKYNFVASTMGFEYSFIGIQDSDADLGLVVEYLYDNRGQLSTAFFQNDVMLGLRLALNDEQSTEALLGAIVDLDNNEALISLEASRRLGDAWKLALEVRFFQNIDSASLFNSLKKDDYIQMDLAYYF